MDRTTKTNKWIGRALAAALACTLLAGCGGGQVPNQRVYDRYASLMQERVRQMQPSSQASAQSTAPAAVAPSKASAAPAKPAPVAKPAPAAQPKAKPAAPAPRKPVAPKPAPAPAPAPAPEPEPIVEEPPVEVIPPPVVEPELIVEPEPEVLPPPEPEPEPAPVAVVPPPPPAQPAPIRSASDVEAEQTAYALRVGDGVAITLRGIPTPEKIECQVDEYGMIPLPLINDVRAEGLSAAELQKNIRQIYLDRGIYKNINVTVLIPTRYYYTQGEFKSQGKFQLVSAITLSQAIAASGYFTDFASGEVYIRRNGVIFKTIGNARKLDRTPEDDILIEPNDIIEARRRWF